ncbi:MAG: hypothetical protein ICV72_04790 [Aldersonia sp.]|nr:hypothetical protein [Aldersonia sp.]
MNTHDNPRDAVRATLAAPPLWPGNDERFAGYGVMGLPFSSGDYLALRHFGASTVGPPYRAIWHRNPDAVWTFYSTTTPEQSCARYFARDQVDATVQTDIEVQWDDPYTLAVTAPGHLTWQIELTRAPSTAVLSTIGRRLPVAAWRSAAFLHAMAVTARPMLRSGRIGLTGTVPNGQHFVAAPRTIWPIAHSTAVLHGVDFGEPRPLPRQARLGDFWLPQRGLFAVGNAAFA